IFVRICTWIDITVLRISIFSLMAVGLNCERMQWHWSMHATHGRPCLPRLACSHPCNVFLMTATGRRLMDTPFDDELLQRALKECASEPVHAPGAIQAHGALV